MVPAAPTGLASTPGNETLLVRFTPGVDNGAVIDEHRIRVKPDSRANWAAGDITEFGNVRTQYLIDGLVNGDDYDVQISSHNSEGWGAWSATHTDAPEAQAP